MLSPQWLSSKKRPNFSLPPAPVGVVTFLFNNDEMKLLLQINYFIKGSNVQESSDYKSKLISQNSQEQKDNQTRLSLESACVSRYQAPMRIVTKGIYQPRSKQLHCKCLLFSSPLSAAFTLLLFISLNTRMPKAFIYCSSPLSHLFLDLFLLRYKLALYSFLYNSM